MTKPRVRLIHWNAAEAAQRAAALERSGYAVQAGPINPAALKALRAAPVVPSSAVDDTWSGVKFVARHASRC